MFHDQIENTKLFIQPGIWYHVMIEFVKQSSGNSLNVYVNTKKLKTVVTAGKLQGVKKVYLVLGIYPRRVLSRTFSRASICIDNIAIWKSVLPFKERKRIYRAAFGK